MVLECANSWAGAITFTLFNVIDYATVEIREALPALCRVQRIIEVTRIIELLENKLFRPNPIRVLLPACLWF
jgi:hypothetical protein